MSDLSLSSSFASTVRTASMFAKPKKASGFAGGSFPALVNSCSIPIGLIPLPQLHQPLVPILGGLVRMTDDHAPTLALILPGGLQGCLLSHRIVIAGNDHFGD